MTERITYRGFYIDKTKIGYRVSKCEDTDKHSHLKNLNLCYKLINNVIMKRIPHRFGIYYLESHIRLSDDKECIHKIREYIEVKQNKGKKLEYYNPSRKKAGGTF